jgi:hypothetical protein
LSALFKYQFDGSKRFEIYPPFSVENTSFDVEAGGVEEVAFARYFWLIETDLNDVGFLRGAVGRIPDLFAVSAAVFVVGDAALPSVSCPSLPPSVSYPTISTPFDIQARLLFTFPEPSLPLSPAPNSCLLVSLVLLFFTVVSDGDVSPPASVEG